jgi:hypothetical protein
MSRFDIAISSDRDLINEITEYNVAICWQYQILPLMIYLNREVYVYVKRVREI